VRRFDGNGGGAGGALRKARDQLLQGDLSGLASSLAEHPGLVDRRWPGDEIPYDGIDCFRARAGKGGALKRPEAHGDDFEICWVWSGRLRIELPAESYNLGPGEALKFDAILPHTYEILEDAELSIIHLKKTHRF